MGSRASIIIYYHLLSFSFLVRKNAYCRAFGIPDSSSTLIFKHSDIDCGSFIGGRNGRFKAADLSPESSSDRKPLSLRHLNDLFRAQKRSTKRKDTASILCLFGVKRILCQILWLVSRPCRFLAPCPYVTLLSLRLWILRIGGQKKKTINLQST